MTFSKRGFGNLIMLMCRILIGSRFYFFVIIVVFGWSFWCNIPESCARIELKSPDPKTSKLLFDSQLSADVFFCCYETDSRNSLTVQIDCSGSCSSYVLYGRLGGSIPVRLELRNNNGVSEILKTGIPVMLSNATGNNCNGKNREVKISINRNDVSLENMPYYNHFFIIAKNSKGKKKNRRFNIRLDAQEFIRVSGLQDLLLNSGNNWQSSNERVCVFSTIGSYTVTVTSSNNGSLANGLSMVPYNFFIKESTQWQSLGFGQPYTNVISSDSELCTDSKFIGIKVQVNEFDLNNAPSGNYSDVVTFTVEAI